ncbi:MAG: ACP S-malonyltransferase [Phycisphaerales bacterium]
MSDTPLIVLCPGQGAQAVGMGKGWFDGSPEARRVFEDADRILGDRLGATLTDLCFNGPADRLNRTDISQPAIYATSVACWRGLLAKWSYGNGESKLAAVAGLSLGEYTALTLAGAISFEDGLNLVALRGRAMQDAAEATPSGMLALIGADDAQAEAVCEEARGPDVLVAANFNAPGQVVISGSKAAIERAAGVATAKGLRSAVLPVAGAFHSPLMAPAATRLEEALAKAAIRDPRCPVVSNVTARPHEPATGRTMADSVRRKLVEQLTSPVRWAESCRWVLANVKGEHHELAPGATLAGLMRRIDRATKVMSHDHPE